MGVLSRFGNGQEYNTKCNERKAERPKRRRVSSETHEEECDSVREKDETDDKKSLDQVHRDPPYEA